MGGRGGAGRGWGGGGVVNIQQKIKRKVWVIVLISFLWENFVCILGD